MDEVVIRMTEVTDVGPVCAQYVPGKTVLACSVVRDEEGYCEIIVPPNSPGLVAHEAAHCLGYKHPGGKDITASLRLRMHAEKVRNATTAAAREPSGPLVP